MLPALGWSACVATTAAIAPASCATFSLISNRHSPRWMNATLPARLPAGSVLQKRPVGSNVLASTTGPRTGLADPDALPGMPTNGSTPSNETLAAKMRSLIEAPAAIADGAVAGDPMVASPGPSFPAATTTTTPARMAFSTAFTSGSSSGRRAGRLPRLRLMTSMPSFTASLSASRIARSGAPFFASGNTL